MTAFAVPPPVPRVDVLGTHISALTPQIAVDEISHWVENRVRSYVCVTGVHGVMESVRDAGLRHVHNASGLTIPEGMPLVWTGRWAGAHWMRRVYGPDLMLAILERAAERGWSSYLYGAEDGVPELLARRLTERIPGLNIVGGWSPPFRPLTSDEDDAVVQRINDSGADLVWVGLPSPGQEQWIADHRDRLTAPALLGIGSAFDFHAGLKPQAPALLQEHGLEWTYRLAREPRRLWRRYLRNNPAYLARIAVRPPTLLSAPIGPVG